MNVGDDKVRCEKFELASGYDVWRWPEFRAFAKRLGLSMEEATERLTIEIPCDGLVRIEHEHGGLDVTKEKE